MFKTPISVRKHNAGWSQRRLKSYSEKVLLCWSDFCVDCSLTWSSCIMNPKSQKQRIWSTQMFIAALFGNNENVQPQVTVLTTNLYEYMLQLGKISYDEISFPQKSIYCMIPFYTILEIFFFDIIFV